MAVQIPRIPVAPMPASRRLGIATAFSIMFHLLAVVIIGLLAMRSPEARKSLEKLIPVELTMAEPPQQQVVRISRAKQQQITEYAPAPVKRAAIVKALKERPSNAGGTEQRALSAPRILTAKERVGEPAGETGKGTAAGGPGGKVDSDEGPTYGPAAIGGGGPLPIYPKNALDQNLEGSVTLTINVGDEGAITSVEIAKSSGHKILDEAAVRAIRKGWAFKPGMTKGKLTPGKSTITFEFSAGAVK